jgi:hypothetical protein
MPVDAGWGFWQQASLILRNTNALERQMPVVPVISPSFLGAP